ncbi:MAG: septum formation initiator family protein [Candidatus Moranbacteria bacterium]|jgi:cell division protein FtsB|nr:septum formation initiator family protein [Candidatus Moranbacteria bacterium]
MENLERSAKRTKVFLIRIFIILGMVVLFYAFYKLSNVIYQQNATEREIMSLQEEIDRLDKENRNMEDMIAYFKTDEFKEKEAKDKLNLVKDGEQVVFLKEKEVIKEEELEEQKPEVTVDKPNYYWWWHYFFSI